MSGETTPKHKLGQSEAEAFPIGKSYSMMGFRGRAERVLTREILFYISGIYTVFGSFNTVITMYNDQVRHFCRAVT